VSDSENPATDALSAETIGTALVKRRKQLAIGMSEAAERIAMSRTTYSSYERDRQRPSVDVFPVLAEFLNVTTDELLTLYGATSIAVIRPALERFLAAPKEQPHVTANADVIALSSSYSAPTEPTVTTDITSTSAKVPIDDKKPKPKKKKKKGKHTKG